MEGQALKYKNCYDYGTEYIFKPFYSFDCMAPFGWLMHSTQKYALKRRTFFSEQLYGTIPIHKTKRGLYGPSNLHKKYKKSRDHLLGSITDNCT